MNIIQFKRTCFVVSYDSWTGIDYRYSIKGYETHCNVIQIGLEMENEKVRPMPAYTDEEIQNQIACAKNTANTALNIAGDAQGTANSKSIVRIDGVKKDVNFKSCPQTQIDRKADKEELASLSDRLQRHIEDAVHNNTGGSGGGLDRTAILNIVYPVGAIYISVASARPSDMFGGTWERFGNGRVLVGVDETSGIEKLKFPEEIGGENEHVLNIMEMPSHGHATSVSTNGAHSHGYNNPVKTNGGAWQNDNKVNEVGSERTSEEGQHTHTITLSNNGGGLAHNNMQEYITVFMWKRTG